jgi:hypothetical protein
MPLAAGVVAAVPEAEVLQEGALVAAGRLPAVPQADPR